MLVSTGAACLLLVVPAAFGGQNASGVITAKSASLEDVSSAIASARDGDLVKVPAGTATWTSTLTITKNITVEGAGSESTVIIDEVPRPARKEPGATDHGQRGRQNQGGRRSNLAGAGRGKRPAPPDPARAAFEPRGSFLISIGLRKDEPFRLTGFTFKGGDVNTQKTFNGEIRIMGNSHAFRIDHCTFDRLHGTNLGVAGFLWGVVDHCRFNLADEQPMHISHETWNGGNYGNGSWADDPYWGSEKFVFIEDNVFDNTGWKRAIDGYEGARFVVRYNQFHNCGVSVHGTEGRGRGAKEVEEYNNTYRYDKNAPAGQIRSGCIVTHDNTWTNVAKGHVLEVYRPYSYSPHWGYCNGQSPYDDNAPNGTTGYWETGKHTGPNGSSVLMDSTKNWATNQWYQLGAIYIVRNIMQENAGKTQKDKPQSFAISNTADSITVSSFTHVGAPGAAGQLTFNAGDVYQIWKVVHAIDQPGLGKGDLLDGLPGLPAKWPNQVTEPCYSWNNTQNGEPRNLVSTEPCIKEGRDFFNGRAKPGYKPYIYPHPLVKDGLPSAARPGRIQSPSEEN